MSDKEAQANYECGYCGAKPGEPCIDIWGNPQEIHRSRVSAAREKLRREQKDAA